MVPLFAIDPSGIGQIPKYNTEQLDVVALHTRVRKLKSVNHTRDVISELQSKSCDELEYMNHRAKHISAITWQL